MTLTSRRRVLRWTLRSSTFDLTRRRLRFPQARRPTLYSAVLAVCVLLLLFNGYSFVLDIGKRSLPADYLFRTKA